MGSNPTGPTTDAEAMLVLTAFPLSAKENELILMVRSSDPQSVLEQISQAKTIGEYQVTTDRTVKIHDIYFDTESRSLGRSRLNLRLREIDGKWRITLKKSPGLFTRNRNQRDETELDWLPVNWRRILEEIRKHGVKLDPQNSGPPLSEMAPLDSALSSGLEIIQDRETLRRTRDFVSLEGEVLAELALDTVTYHFPSGNVRLDELEVEAKSKRGNAKLQDIVEDLATIFSPHLYRWRMGKLRTGTVIERLLKEGRLEKYRSDNGRLEPQAYDLIASG